MALTTLPCAAALACDVAENRDTAQQYQLNRARPHSLKKGFLVYKFDFTHLTDTSPKLTPKWKWSYKLK
jgi:hypothetical protein